MPYLTRKRIKLFLQNPLGLGIQLDDDSLPKHYEILNAGSETKIRGTATLLTDKNGQVICAINRDYEFLVESHGYYTDKGCVYDRRLWFPSELTRDFAIDADMGIELLFRETVFQNEATKIFSERLVEGSMEFEPKVANGGVLPYSEFLITTKFTDEFYDKLVLETNSAFRLRLFNATMVLVRKLFENLIIDLLRQKYGDRPPEKELYYSNKRYHHFSTLINNFEARVDDFKPYSVNFQHEKTKNDFFKFLRDIKERGDACAHSIEIIHDPSEIDILKPLINKYSDLIVRLTKAITETPHN